jgi:hypothetical protein
MSDLGTHLLPLKRPTLTRRYTWISTRWPVSGWSKYQQNPGPSKDGDLICPKVFPERAARLRESIVMLHTATRKTEVVIFRMRKWRWAHEFCHISDVCDCLFYIFVAILHTWRLPLPSTTYDRPQHRDLWPENMCLHCVWFQPAANSAHRRFSHTLKFVRQFYSRVVNTLHSKFTYTSIMSTQTGS